MLRRKFMIAITGGFRYLVSKVKMVLGLRSDFGTGKGVDVESKLNTHYDHTAEMLSREAGELKSQHTTSSVSVSEPSSATVVNVESKRKTKARLKSGLVSHLISELWHKVNSIIDLKSDLEAANGASIDSKTEHVNQLKSDIIPANSSVSESILFTGQHMASEFDTGESADAIIGLESKIRTVSACVPTSGCDIESHVSTQANLRSDLKTWIYPDYDKDGVFIIKQVYSATLNNGVLEVS